MAEKTEISVKPLSFGMTGFKVIDLVIKEFQDELIKEFPTSIITNIIIGFSDSKDVVFLSHDRREGKFELERVDIEGSKAEMMSTMVEILKKVMT